MMDRLLFLWIAKTKHNLMTIQQAQKIVNEWISTTGVRYFNELTNTALLMEEVGEVARIMARCVDLYCQPNRRKFNGSLTKEFDQKNKA